MQAYDTAKLTQNVVNMDNMGMEEASAFQNAHTVFCALGTTRKVAIHPLFEPLFPGTVVPYHTMELSSWFLQG